MPPLRGPARRGPTCRGLDRGHGEGSGPHTIAGMTRGEPSGTDAGMPPELIRLRSSIDNIDAALVHLLAERFKATQQVGELTAAQGLPPADAAREERQIARLRALAHDAGLDPQFAEKFLNFIIAEVIRHHEAIAADSTD